MGARGDSRAPLEAARLTERRPPRGSALLATGLCLAAGLLLAGGCGGRSGGARTVVFWQFSPLEAIRPILARFEAEHPGVRVQVEQLTWQSGREKIVAAVAAGMPPDLCEIGSTFLPGLVADSALVDLTESVSDLVPDLLGWEIVRARSRTYALPWLLGTRALYGNTRLLREAGIDSGSMPMTWPELASAVARVDRAGAGVRGFGMNAGEREVLFKKFMPFAWGNGGGILDSTLTRSVVASPANLEALRYYLGLKSHALLDRQEMLDQAFARGRVGFTISGPWLLRRLPEIAPDLEYQVGLMPRPAPGKGTHASFAGAEVLGIFRTAKNPQDALALARFLVRTEHAMPLYVATGNAFPAAVAAERDSYFAAHPKDRVFVEQLRTAVSPPLHPRWVEIEEVLNGELEQALHGAKSPEAALRSADARIAEILKRGP